MEASIASSGDTLRFQVMSAYYPTLKMFLAEFSKKDAGENGTNVEGLVDRAVSFMEGDFSQMKNMLKDKKSLWKKSQLMFRDRFGDYPLNDRKFEFSNKSEEKNKNDDESSCAVQ